MHNNDSGEGEGGIRSQTQALELINSGLVNVAPTQVKLLEKPKNKPANESRRDKKTVDAEIHDKFLNGTGKKVKL